MSKQPQNLDEDISSTLEKLHILLQYSKKVSADEVLAIIEQARSVWNEEEDPQEPYID